MRLFGNLMNRIAETYKSPDPVVGMGATILMFSDRYPATVIEVKGQRVAIQEDNSIRIDQNGMSESQEYVYVSNKEAPIRWFSKRKNGRYQEVNGETCIVLGSREKYHDFSF